MMDQDIIVNSVIIKHNGKQTWKNIQSTYILESGVIFNSVIIKQGEGLVYSNI